jgi:hypothetical protein
MSAAYLVEHWRPKTALRRLTLRDRWRQHHGRLVAALPGLEQLEATGSPDVGHAAVRELSLRDPRRLDGEWPALERLTLSITDRSQSQEREALWAAIADGVIAPRLTELHITAQRSDGRLLALDAISARLSGPGIVRLRALELRGLVSTRATRATLEVLRQGNPQLDLRLIVG